MDVSAEFSRELSSDGLRLTIRIGAETRELDAAEVAGTIVELCKIRSKMLPPVSEEPPPFETIPTFSPPRFVPYVAKDGKHAAIVHLDPGRGWLAMMVPADAALALAAEFQKLGPANLVPPPTPLH